MRIRLLNKKADLHISWIKIVLTVIFLALIILIFTGNLIPFLKSTGEWIVNAFKSAIASIF